MANWKKVHHISPYVPIDPNKLRYFVDVDIEGIGVKRIDNMPFEQMNLLVLMAHTKVGLHYDPEQNHFGLGGSGIPGV